MMQLTELLNNFKRKRTSVKADFKAFLRQNNCKSAEYHDKDDKSTRYYFDYQGGHFVADIKDNNRGVDITFPGIADMPIDELPLVRTLCNHYNASNTLLKFTYSTSEEDNKAHVHLSFFANTVWPDELPESLTACFFFQRQFCDEYQRLRQSALETGTDDVERDHQLLVRERHLLAEQEMRHQPGQAEQWDLSTGKPSINQLLERMLGLKGVSCSAVELDGQTTLDGNDPTALDTVASRLSADHVLTALARLTLGDSDSVRYATLLFVGEPSDSDTAEYCRVTATLTAAAPSRTASLNSESQLPQSCTALIALGGPDAAKQRAEFDYMWKDAQLKRRDGEALDELQQLIVDVSDANIAYNMYWGRKLMLDGCYCQALPHLENAFNALRTLYLELNKELQGAFTEICYYIGFCYTELRLYRDAYYYLDYVRGGGNVRHTTELINCLANGKDFRLFSVTDDIAQAIREQYEHDEDIPDGLQRFISFMRRRRAYALIDHHQLDQAEKAFTALLDDPESSDYALSELAYIKRLRENEKQ